MFVAVQIGSLRDADMNKVFYLVLVSLLVHFPTIAEAKPLNRAEIKKEMLGKVINTRRFGLSIKLLYRTNGTVSARSIAGNLKGTWRYSGSTKVCTSFPSGPAKGTSCVSFTKIGEKKFRSSEGVNFTVR